MSDKVKWTLNGKEVSHEEMMKKTAGITSGKANTQLPQCWPMKSYAAGVIAPQAVDAEKEAANLGVPTEFCRDTGDAIFTGRKHRADYLRAKQMCDRDAGYGDPAPTAY